MNVFLPSSFLLFILLSLLSQLDLIDMCIYIRDCEKNEKSVKTT